jgi:hypothetical protein
VSVTVADLVTSGPGAGLPDLVVAVKGANKVVILLGQMQNGSLTFVPGPRLDAGAGPVSTVVESLSGEANPSLLISDSQGNQVRMIRGLGQGFFDDLHPVVIPVGVDPGPLFVGDFTGQPGELDLVTVNPGSDSLSFVPNFLDGGQFQSIDSGGSEPVAAIAFANNGVEDLLVANEGDGALALFLGGPDGLGTPQTMENPDVPNPTALAFDALSGNVLQFYAGTQGRETATLLAFNLGGEAGGGKPLVPTPTTTVAVQQVARLQPLGGSSSLALVATLLTVSAEGEPASIEQTVAVTPGLAGALPNQKPVQQDPIEDHGAVDEALDQEDAPAAPAPTPGSLTPLLRFLHGLDEALERLRSDAHRDVPTTHITETGRVLLAWDAALDRWSPALATLDPTAQALAGGLARIGTPTAHLIDSALRSIPLEGTGTISPELGPPDEPPGASPASGDLLSPIASAAALWLSCQAWLSRGMVRKTATPSTPRRVGSCPG